METDRIDIVQLDVTGSLRDSVSALVAVEMHDRASLPLAIAPHESMMFTVQMGRGADTLDQKAEHGHNTRLTGIRQWTGSFVGAGQCVSLFALLTPLGAVRLLESRTLAAAPRIRADVAHLLDRQITRRLEDAIARAACSQAGPRARSAPGSRSAMVRGANSRARRCAPAARRCASPRSPSGRSTIWPTRSTSRAANSNATSSAGSAPRRTTWHW